MKILKFLLERLKEPSSSASLSALFSPIYMMMYTGLAWETAVPAMVLGAFGFFKSESK